MQPYSPEPGFTFPFGDKPLAKPPREILKERVESGQWWVIPCLHRHTLIAMSHFEGEFYVPLHTALFDVLVIIGEKNGYLFEARLGLGHKSVVTAARISEWAETKPIGHKNILLLDEPALGAGPESKAAAQWEQFYEHVLNNKWGGMLITEGPRTLGGRANG